MILLRDQFSVYFSTFRITHYFTTTLYKDIMRKQIFKILTRSFKFRTYIVSTGHNNQKNFYTNMFIQFEVMKFKNGNSIQISIQFQGDLYKYHI